MTMKPDRLQFETCVHWAFSAETPCDIPHVTRYKSEFLPGERMSLSRAVAEARAATGLGRILAEGE